MTADVTLGAALRSTINSINRTQHTIDVITQRLATGQKVNSAIDQPQNFFIARELKNVSSDNSRLLDGIGQSIRTVQEGIIGLEATERLLDQGESIVLESQAKLQAGVEDLAVEEIFLDNSPPPISDQILVQAPDVYFRLNETAGAIVDYGSGGAGPVGATRNGGAAANATALYANGAAPSVNFDGVNDRIRVSDSSMINTATTPARTVELVFNADDVSGRQVLYEEGATVNGLTIYIDNGLLRFEAEDDQGGNRFGDLDISAPVVAGQTYHAAFVFDGAAQTFGGYIDGVNISTLNITSDALFPSHSGDIGIGGVNGGVQFHDGESGVGNGFNFDGRISDVAIYNRTISDAILLSHAESLNNSTSFRYENTNFNNVLNELDQIVIDANYRGLNLLQGEDLQTNFNREGSSILITEGKDLSVDGLGIRNFNFNDETDLNEILDQIKAARTEVREFAFTLSNDLSIIQIRDTFTKDTIITLEAGAEDLTLADQNEEGANLLASQTRLALGTTALSIANQIQNSVIGIIRGNR